MPRPENLNDIDPERKQIAYFTVENIGAHPALLKAYATFMEMAQKAGVEVEPGTYSTTFYRPPTMKEQASQLKYAQDQWDRYQGYYDQMAAVGKCEDKYDENRAQEHAERENLPWPPLCEPLSDFDAVIRGINEAVDEAVS